MRLILSKTVAEQSFFREVDVQVEEAISTCGGLGGRATNAVVIEFDHDEYARLTSNFSTVTTMCVIRKERLLGELEIIS